MAAVAVHVGTSGYSYKEWKGAFYPADLAAAKMLGFYADRFPTVEINNTFYQFPKAATLEGQAAQVPPAFTFAFKAPGRITHQGRLKDVGEPVAHLWDTVKVLGPRLGPVLFGLPPNMKKDAGRLAALLAACPKDRRVALEFRNETWFDDEVYGLLEGHGNAALCVADAEDLSTPWRITAPWAYLRLRRCDYDDAALQGWAAKVKGAGVGDAVVYFKHEDEGLAPKLAARFEELCKA
jgi:uncharacterized protein YecE (DUF72 family)